MTKEQPRIKRPNRASLARAVVVAVIALLGISGCGTGSATAGPTTQASPQTPADRLAVDDLNQAPDADIVAKYGTALDGLAAHCAEDKSTLANEIILGRQDLVKNGVEDETNLTLIDHLTSSIPNTGGRVDCRGILAAYLVLREPA